MSGPHDHRLPVAVIGAGPIGLAAAAHLHERGLGVVVLEAGQQAAAAVRGWGHVRLFSPWAEVVDPAARRILEQGAWAAPDPAHNPTGQEWAHHYLQPLADALGGNIRYGVRVTGVARAGRDLVVDGGRAEQPFTLHLTHDDGTSSRLTARAVIDASGTANRPNPLGADGYRADGESEASEHISYRVPSLHDGADAARFAGRHVAVVGAGHSALTALLELTALSAPSPAASITWVLRRGEPDKALGGGAADELPARGALGLAVREAVRAGRITLATGFRTAAVEPRGEHVDLTDDAGRRLDGLDEIVVLTGFRPDHSLMSELRLDLDHRLQAPRQLAPLIDPNIHSCGTVYPHGAAELAHSLEPDVYIVGMKSYGRAPTFLAMTGYEQVRSVVASIAGDHDAAARVELSLPETGVCGGAGLFDPDDTTTAEGCCADPRTELTSVGAVARSSTC